MAVSTAYAPLSYNGNDATTAFAVTWPFFDDDDLVVTLVSSTGAETVQTKTTHYSVSGGTDSDGLPATGTVTMVTAPATSSILRIQRVTPKVQSTEWTKSGSFGAKSVEAGLDRAMLIAQESGSGGGAAYDDITGDVLSLDSSGATDFWDGEDQIIRNVATAIEATDATPYAQVAALIAAASAPIFGTLRTATESTTIANGEHVVMANPSSATVTIDSGIEWCLISRSIDSAANVTVISADAPSQTISDDATGVVINEVIGPVWFVQDPSVATNIITVVPALTSGGTASGQPWVGTLTVAQLNALTSVATSSGGFASDGRKNGEGAGLGTGVPVFYDGTAWRAGDTGATVAA